MSRSEEFHLARIAASSGAFSPEDAQDLNDAISHAQKARRGEVEGSSPINAADAQRIGSSHRLHAHLEDAGFPVAPLTKHSRGVGVDLGTVTVKRPPESYDPDIPDHERVPTSTESSRVSLVPNDDGSVHASIIHTHWDPAQEVRESATLRGLPHTASDLRAFINQYPRPS